MARIRLRCPAKEGASTSRQIDVFWCERVARVRSKVQVFHPHHNMEERDRGGCNGSRGVGLEGVPVESL